MRRRFGDARIVRNLRAEHAAPVVHADDINDLPRRLAAIVHHRQQNSRDVRRSGAPAAVVAVPAQKVCKRLERQIIGANWHDQMVGQRRDAQRKYGEVARRIDDHIVNQRGQRADAVRKAALGVARVAQRGVNVREG